MFLERCVSLSLARSYVRSLERVHALLVAQSLVSSDVVARARIRALVSLSPIYLYMCVMCVCIYYCAPRVSSAVSRIDAHTYRTRARARSRSRRRTQPPLLERFTTLAASGSRSRLQNATMILSMRDCTHAARPNSPYTRVPCFSFFFLFLRYPLYAMRRTRQADPHVALRVTRLERDTRPRQRCAVTPAALPCDISRARVERCERGVNSRANPLPPRPPSVDTSNRGLNSDRCLEFFHLNYPIRKFCI